MNDRQRAFCAEYIVDLNVTQAAIRAGYSARTAGVTGHKLLKNPNIASEIRRVVQERAERTAITADTVVRDLADLAGVDIRSVIRIDDGEVLVRDTDKLTDPEARAIQEITQTASGGMRVKMVDRLKVLELLGRHLGVFVPDTQVNVGIVPPPLVIKGVDKHGRVTDGTHISDYEAQAEQEGDSG